MEIPTARMAIISFSVISLPRDKRVLNKKAKGIVYFKRKGINIKTSLNASKMFNPLLITMSEIVSIFTMVIIIVSIRRAKIKDEINSFKI